VAGRTLRRIEAGSGRPSVVLEAGRNDVAASWRPVMDLLAPDLHVVAYDRAGLGSSPRATDPVILARQLADLTTIITTATAGRCVLAGHSWGGVLVQLLAFRRPDLAAGLVLVDPGHEEMDSALPLSIRWGWRTTRAFFPDELHEDAPVTFAAVRELRAAARSFPDVPVVVLSAARGFPRRFRAHWTRLQAGLAAAAPQGRHVVVEGTGHNIPRNRPGVVARAILDVVAQTQSFA
jgi:pimeloyl-ACP methyl ester carboxylesterase